MNTLKDMPQLMIVICNIQAMKGKTIRNYDAMTDFKVLAKLTDDQLHELQNSLIAEYNKAIK